MTYKEFKKIAGKPEIIEKEKCQITRQVYENWILDFIFYGDINTLELSVECGYTFKVATDYCPIWDKKNSGRIHEEMFAKMTQIVEANKEVEYPVGKVKSLPKKSWQKKEDIHPIYEEVAELEGNEKSYVEDGYKCFIRRILPMNFLCGYVGVNRQSPLFGLSYTLEIFNEIQVHGGLTFSGGVVPDKDYWYFGFDCAHIGDVVLNFHRTDVNNNNEATYKNMNFVKKEISALVKQIKQMEYSILEKKEDE